jgi:hypothetical protein
MSQTMKTYLMLGVRIPCSEMPEDIFLNYCETEETFFDKNAKIKIIQTGVGTFFDKNTKIEIIQTGVGNDDDDYVVGYVIGNYEEMSDDSIIEKEISFIEDFASIVGNAIKKKLDIKMQKVRLIMFTSLI